MFDDWNSEFAKRNARIIMIDEDRRFLQALSRLTSSFDNKSRYKAPHAPGQEHRLGNRVRDWERR